MTGISIIIPVYNGGNSLKRCLESVHAQITDNDEIIVVNDASSDNSLEIAKKYATKIITLKKRSGPANARNEGAKAASCQYLYFLDSDTMLANDNLQKLKSHFIDNPEIKVIQSLWSHKPLDEGFSARFLALRAYYVTDVDNFRKNKISRKASWFYSANSAIDRKLFLSLGGFDTSFKDPGGEEYEFGHRLRKKLPIFDYSDLIVYHTFGNISARANELIYRTARWSKLFISEKKFESSQATLKHMISSFFGFGSVITIPLILLNGFIYKIPFLFCESCLLFTRFDFIKLMLREENLWFALRGLAAEHVLLFSTALGGGLGILQKYWILIFPNHKHKLIA